MSGASAESLTFLDTIRDVVRHAYAQNGVIISSEELAKQTIQAWIQLIGVIQAKKEASTINIKWPG